VFCSEWLNAGMWAGKHDMRLLGGPDNQNSEKDEGKPPPTMQPCESALGA
jgi:hypothetical protein